jgi:ribosomal protein L40E
VNPCPHCGAVNPSESQQCAKCGEPLALEVVRCTGCGAFNPRSARWCGACGIPLPMPQASRGSASLGGSGAPGEPFDLRTVAPFTPAGAARQADPASADDPTPEGFSIPDDLARLRDLAHRLGMPAESAPSAIELPDAGRWADHLIALLIILVLLIPLLFGIHLPPLPPASAARGFARAIEALPAGALTVVAFEWEPSTAGEMALISTRVLDWLLSRRVRVAAVSTNPAGAVLAEDIFDRLVTTRGYQYGVDFVDLGYVSGGEAGLVMLATDVRSVTPRDDRWRAPIAALPATRDLRSFADARLLVILAADDQGVVQWIQQVQPRVERPIIAATAASARPLLLPYVGGEMASLDGLVAGIPDLTSVDGEAMETMGELDQTPIAFGQIALVSLIVAGNVIVLSSRFWRWISGRRGK